jgi:regulator of protease activity HflC (stomatin/prohibitin superfamily)
MSAATLVIGLILAAILVAILVSGIRVLQDYEQGLHIRLGRFKATRRGGFHWILPFADRMVRIDTRTQVIDVPPQDCITKDNAPVRVDAIVIARVTDAQKTYYQIGDHEAGIVALSQTGLRAIVGDMHLDETLTGRDRINAGLRQALEKQSSEWGVKVENVEVKEVEPSKHVKESMERQSSAERNRRATITEAEGVKQSQILKAEGERESAILTASGDKEAALLRAEGEAGSLHLLAVGASLVDDRALALRGLEALKVVGSSPSTKLVVPLELSNALQGLANLGGVQKGGKAAVERLPVEELERKTGLDVKRIFAGRQDPQAGSTARRAARAASRGEPVPEE